MREFVARDASHSDAGRISRLESGDEYVATPLASVLNLYKECGLDLLDSRSLLRFYTPSFLTKDYVL